MTADVGRLTGEATERAGAHAGRRALPAERQRQRAPPVLSPARGSITFLAIF